MSFLNDPVPHHGWARARIGLVLLLAVSTPVAGETRTREDPEQVESLVAQAIRVAGEQPDYARQLLRRALILAEAEAEGPLEAARQLNDSGNLIYDRGLPAEVSREYFEAALRVRAELLPGSLELAGTLHDLANVLVDLGELDTAQKYHERALEIRRHAAPNSVHVAHSLHGLGTVEQRRGDLKAAETHYRDALNLFETSGAGDSLDRSATLSNLGNIACSRGDLGSAESYLRRALDIQQKHGSPSVAMANTLNNLGIVAEQRGDFEEAERYYENALNIDTALAPGSLYMAVTLRNLGLVAMARRDIAAATNYLGRSVAILQKLAPDSPYAAGSLTTLGDLAFERGDLDTAEDLYRRSLIMMESGLRESPSLACSLTGLGDVMRVRGQFDAAEEYYGRAVAFAKRILGPDHPDVGRILNHRAVVLAAQQDDAGALEAALEAERIGREHLRLTVRYLPERQALLYATARVSGLETALGLAINSARLDSTATTSVWDALVRSRSLVLDELARRNRSLDERRDPELMRLADAVASARENLARVIVSGPRDEHPWTYGELLHKKRSDKEEAERALAQRSASFEQEQALTGVGLDDVVKALESDEALVAYARLEESGSTSDSRSSFYLAFVQLGNAGTPLVVPLGAAGAIDDLVLAIRNNVDRLTSDPTRSLRRSETRYRRIALSLRKKVWDPLENHLRGARKVYVVPEGELNFINLEALPSGRAEFLIEQAPAIRYLSTERDLVFERSHPMGEGLLALGDPDFNKVSPAPPGTRAFRGGLSTCADFQSLVFTELPETSRELMSIGEIWNEGQSRNAPAAAGEAMLLQGTSATEEAFKAMAPGRRVVHVATHGFLLPGRCRPLLERLLGPEEAESPMLLAGLAMAGANNRDATGENREDGVLTAEEVAALDLRETELAVLSACDTGAGELGAGEGVLGLRRAFRIAGVQSLVMSLWPVEDESGREWMNEFYRQYVLTNASAAESARRASLEILLRRRSENKSTHPFYWAGFIASSGVE